MMGDIKFLDTLKVILHRSENGVPLLQYNVNISFTCRPTIKTTYLRLL